MDGIRSLELRALAIGRHEVIMRPPAVVLLFLPLYTPAHSSCQISDPEQQVAG